MLPKSFYDHKSPKPVTLSFPYGQKVSYTDNSRYNGSSTAKSAPIDLGLHDRVSISTYPFSEFVMSGPEHLVTKVEKNLSKNNLGFACKSKRIVEFDVMEVSPHFGNVAPDFFAAKLIYKFLDYIFHSGKHEKPEGGS